MPEIVVLDTHIWVWWLNDKFSYLSAQQIDCIEQTERVAVSVISCFEIAQLVKRERLILPLPVNDWLQEALAPAGVELLPLSPAITCRAVDLTDIHKDPFDRMIIATALNYHAK
jgi:PIN domain nuclease of toxin-antitoxin system